MPVMRYGVAMSTGELVRLPGASSDLDPATGARVRVLAAAWLASFAVANTRAAYDRDLRRWLSWASAHGVDPLRVLRPHVDAYVREMELEDPRPRPTTVARRLAALSSFYAYAVDVEALGANPAASVRRPKTSEAYVDLTPALDRDELSRLVAAAVTPRDRALVLVLAVEALRVSEALSLDLDGTETVRGHVTYVVEGKGGRVDRIPLPPLVVDAFAAVAESEGRSSGPVFVGEDGARMSRHGVARVLARLSRAAGLSRTVRPHVLRATAITAALDAGASLRDVQDLARHSDPRTTRRYDRSRGALDRHASYVLAAVLSESVSA